MGVFIAVMGAQNHFGPHGAGTVGVSGLAARRMKATATETVFSFLSVLLTE